MRKKQNHLLAQQVAHFYNHTDSNLEEKLSKIRCYEFYSTTYYHHLKVGSFEALKKIHQFIFQDVYAQYARTVRVLDISKTIMFCKALFIEANAQIIENLPQNTFDEIVEKYVEMNILHPFYEGNGRSTRIWLDTILIQKLGQIIDWTKINKTIYLKAMQESIIDDGLIKIQ